MSKDSVNSGRKNGRPYKGDPPRVPYEELDRILVFGEIVECEDGESTTVHYPSYRDLARRYSVSNSLIAQYAKKHDCMRRREEAKARIAAKADQKLVELRANAAALSKDDALRIIDNYLGGFEKALSDGRVRFDNPGDFNTMLRLKEFIQGGADSRQEIHASLSLEDIQARHRRAMSQLNAAPTAVRGEAPSGRAKSPGSGDLDTTHDSPSLALHSAPGEVIEQFPQHGDRSLSNAPGAPVRRCPAAFRASAGKRRGFRERGHGRHSARRGTLEQRGGRAMNPAWARFSLARMAEKSETWQLACVAPCDFAKLRGRSGLSYAEPNGRFPRNRPPAAASTSVSARANRAQPGRSPHPSPSRIANPGGDVRISALPTRPVRMPTAHFDRGVFWKVSGQ